MSIIYLPRHRYFFLLLFVAQALSAPMPAWAISDTAFSDMSGFGWVILLFLFLGLSIPVLMSWATYRVLQQRQPDYKAPLLPVLAASFLTQLVGNLTINFVVAVHGIWFILFNIGVIIGTTVLVWNLTRKPLSQ